jgi:splicing factor 3B subunit 2
MSAKAQREKEKRKQRKQKKLQLKTEFKIKKEELKVKQEQKIEDDDIEVEYVTANPFENEEDANEFEEFKDVFGRFTLENGQGAEAAKSEQGVTSGKVEAEPVKEEKLSKKKKKLLRRLPIAVLKSMVERPDLVEPHDTCAANPYMLMHLKAHRNTVPVPRHWSQKRKYLQVW